MRKFTKEQIRLMKVKALMSVDAFFNLSEELLQTFEAAPPDAQGTDVLSEILAGREVTSVAFEDIAQMMQFEAIKTAMVQSIGINAFIAKIDAVIQMGGGERPTGVTHNGLKQILHAHLDLTVATLINYWAGTKANLYGRAHIEATICRLYDEMVDRVDATKH